MNTNLRSATALFTTTCCLSAVAMAAEPPLLKLDISKMESGWGQSTTGKSVDGNPLKIGDKTYTEGVDTHADSSQTIPRQVCPLLRVWKK